MNINILKKDNGISLQDIVIAITIMAMFVGVIGTLFYQITLNSNLIKVNAIAVHYAVQVAEEVDKLAYDEINENFNIYVNSKYDIPDILKLTVDVQNYNEEDETKDDIIKIVNIKVDYTVLDETKSYEIKKLKIKEI